MMKQLYPLSDSLKIGDSLYKINYVLNTIDHHTIYQVFIVGGEYIFDTSDLIKSPHNNYVKIKNGKTSDGVNWFTSEKEALDHVIWRSNQFIKKYTEVIKSFREKYEEKDLES